MKKYSVFLVFLLVLVSTSAAQDTTASFSADDYIKQEADIEMRDGVKLHTVIYRPDSSTQALPFLMKRTPYSCRPYGEDTMPRRIHSNPQMVKEGYIFICQDVRGRWMSEGQYTTMTPNIPGPEGIDESSDTYDTIKWLLENIPNNNGKVCQYGISYSGFYTSASLPIAIPTLDAYSMSSPITVF